MPRKKSPVTRPRIDPGTFRLAVQRLNHYANPGPIRRVALLIPWSRVILEKLTGSRLVKLPTLYGTPKVRYRVYKRPPPVPILSQLDQVHTPTSHFLKIHFNITLPSTLGSSKWSLALRFPHRNPVYTSPLEG
jgi:hypothetical protein